MRPYLIIFFSFIGLTLNAQEQTCWECILAAQNSDTKTALEKCLQIDKKQKLSTEEKQVVSFVIGRLLLADEKPELALKYFSIAEKSSDSLFCTMSKGLIGDCYLETNQLDLALMNYSKAAELANNNLFTPYFVHKQGIVFRIQEKSTDVERIGSRLRVNHTSFFNSLELGTFYGTEPSAYDSINRLLLNHKLPKGPFGVGFINGKQANPELFFKMFEVFKKSHENDSLYGMVTPKDEFLYELGWGALVGHTILESKKMPFALHVTNDEFNAFLYGEKGYPLLPEIRQAFTNSEGIFDKKALAEYCSSNENESDPVAKAGWLELKRAVRDQASEGKYQKLLSLALYVTNKETILSDQFNKQAYDVKGISFPVRPASNSLINYPEKELAKYFQTHKSDCYTDYPAVRKLKYIHFPIESGKADSTAFVNEFSRLKKSFQEAKNDSAFVLQHSDLKSYYPYFWATCLPDSDPRSRENLRYPDELEDEINNAKPGDVIGPYLHEEKFKLAKLIGYNANELTVRHILISSTAEDSPEEHERKRKFANDLLNKVNHQNFAEYVIRYSEDPGSRDSGGVYAHFLDYEMVEPFSNYALNAPIGKIGVVETDFGFHVMEVLERKKVKYPRLTIVEQKLIPSAAVQKAVSSAVDEWYRSMTQKFKQLDLTQKKRLFDSIANLHDGGHSVVINEMNPSVSCFALSKSNEQLLKYAYSKTLRPYELLAPMNDSSSWILPLFVNTYSGEDYNYEQVEELMKYRYMQSKISDSIRLFYSKFTSLQDIGKETTIPLFNETISTGSLYDGNGVPTNFKQYLLSHPEQTKGIHWYSSNGSCIVYEVLAKKAMESATDFSKLKIDLQEKLLDNLNSLIHQNESLTLKTVYNYPLYNLGLRD
jgi:peptidyl-prolyl cis-trans isomerase D